MFVGHYSVAFAARRSSIDLPLWVWFVAVQWLDFVFMTLVLCGVEKVRLVPGFTESTPLDLYYMPYSHGLVGALMISALFAGIVAVVFPAARSAGGAALIGLASFSHWLLDLVMHTPDLPIIDGPEKVGLGLWNHLAVGLPLELGLLAVCVWLYARGGDRSRALRAWGFLVVMALLQVYSHFGPVPPSAQAFAVTALVGYGLLTAGAAWVDRGARHSR